MNSTPKIALIVAVDINNGISKNGEIPWKIKEDSTFFQDVTKRKYEDKKNAVIMGKNTWKELRGGLKGRINIVVSSSMTKAELLTDNINYEAYVVKSLCAAIKHCTDVGKIFICGGHNIYKEALNNYKLDELYITRIYSDFWCTNKFPIDVIMSFAPIFNNYILHTTHNFKVTDLNTNKKVDIEFCKYYKDKQTPKSNKEEQQYLNLLQNILDNGHFRQTRNSNTWSLFGKNMEFDLSNGFPIITTKRVFIRGVFEELLFFLKGDTNAKNLSDKGVKIWDANTSREFLDSHGLEHYQEFSIGPMYGYQLKYFNSEYKGFDHDYTGTGFDQIEYCLNLLKTDPHSRRILMTTYNPAQANEGVLFPCHGIVIQFYVEKNNRLSCSMYQRSGDIFLGIPFNISSWSLLVHMFCEVINNDSTYTGPKFSPGRFVMNLGDVHIYENHYSQCVRQILREPYPFPQLTFKRKVTKLTDFKYEDLELVNYQCYPSIPAKMIA